MKEENPNSVKEKVKKKVKVDDDDDETVAHPIDYVAEYECNIKDHIYYEDNIKDFDEALNRQQAFGDFDKLVSEMNFEGEIPPIRGQDKNVKYFKYRNKRNYQFILKRRMLKMELERPPEGFNTITKEKDPELWNLFNLGMKEFVMCTYFATQPAGIKEMEFIITYLRHKKYFVTEFLMENAGMPVEDFMKEPDLNFEPVKYFTQVIIFLQFVMKGEVFPCELNFENCLVDSKCNFRIFDYKGEQFDDDGTIGYFNKAKEVGSFDYEKQVIFFCGLLGIFISGVCSKEEFKYMLTLNPVNKDIKFLKEKIESIKSFDTILCTKFKRVITACIENDNANKRIHLKQLDLIMNQIKDFKYPPSKLNEDINEYNKENENEDAREEKDRNEWWSKKFKKYKDREDRENEEKAKTYLQNKEELERNYKMLEKQCRQTRDIILELKKSYRVKVDIMSKLETRQETLAEEVKKYKFEKNSLINEFNKLIKDKFPFHKGKVTKYWQIVQITQFMVKEIALIEESINLGQKKLLAEYFSEIFQTLKPDIVQKFDVQFKFVEEAGLKITTGKSIKDLTDEDKLNIFYYLIKSPLTEEEKTSQMEKSNEVNKDIGPNQQKENPKENKMIVYKIMEEEEKKSLINYFFSLIVNLIKENEQLEKFEEERYQHKKELYDLLEFELEAEQTISAAEERLKKYEDEISKLESDIKTLNEVEKPDKEKIKEKEKSLESKTIEYVDQKKDLVDSKKTKEDASKRRENAEKALTTFLEKENVIKKLIKEENLKADITQFKEKLNEIMKITKNICGCEINKGRKARDEMELKQLEDELKNPEAKLTIKDIDVKNRQIEELKVEIQKNADNIKKTEEANGQFNKQIADHKKQIAVKEPYEIEIPYFLEDLNDDNRKEKYGVAIKEFFEEKFFPKNNVNKPQKADNEKAHKLEHDSLIMELTKKPSEQFKSKFLCPDKNGLKEDLKQIIKNPNYWDFRTKGDFKMDILKYIFLNSKLISVGLKRIDFSILKR